MLTSLEFDDWRPFGSRAARMRLPGIVLCAFLLVSACGFAPGNIQTRHSSDIETRKIRRIAVVPPSAADAKPRVPYTASSPESKISEKEAAESLARYLYTTVAAQPGWQVVANSEVEEVGRKIEAMTELARLSRIGELVFADAVITARVLRFRERVGNEIGAKSPASVAFNVELIDVRRGDIVWSARFDETQKALSENIFAIGDIGQRGIRWLSADQLMHDGVKKVIGELHQLLVKGQK
jgi:hypothetical protein